ncbi:ComEC/Rec2 family competence protein [Thermostichus vulcanus]|uniref:ComEC/Rec2 family competence protein n=1 Tax=Thermostichus vulcanus str. 'Rupite' TaxID=2813851 RepID=A0ABT0CBY5_THEVL|nr:ComEC/Rec2 family competence protein [Thermostichus vulcanus]MCJ2543301.1 ComEC/Rec2 family competence protein [Thermostichus vulcanus str. 'Rupite']
MDSTYLLGLGWILGLLMRAWPQGAGWGWGVPLGLGLLGSLLCRRRPRLLRTWLVMGLVGWAAWGYLGWRQPFPSPTDISLLAPQQGISIIGEITSEPRLTRSERLQFWLQAEQVLHADQTARLVSGKLYVTTDPAITQKQDLHPSQRVRLTGSLYLPSPALNPGAFDFQAYLQRQGAFAGLSAQEVVPQAGGRSWGGWTLRRRIRQAFIRGLGEREGNLLASLVLGSRAAQLDFDLQDAFREIGMAHALAASGFHVSLLVGVVFVLTRPLAVRAQQVIILAVLALYLTLTGFSPSVLRAALMGVAAMAVLTEPRLQGKVKLNPLGTLLLAAVVLLVYQPNWITDLGFQLSFTATLGLLVGTAPIVLRLSFLPPTIAAALAIPLAALMWTLPLQIVTFGRIPTYSLLANPLLTALLLPLLVAGFAVAFVALLSPGLGSLLVQPLTLLLTPLINWVGWIASWPFSSYYTGAISLLQCLLLYGALVAVTFWPRWQRALRWQGTALVMIGILIGPGLWPGPPVQITALASGRTPILAIHAEGRHLLMNSGDPRLAERTVLPYLRQRGIHHLDGAVSMTSAGSANGGWATLLPALAIRQFWDGGGVNAASESYLRSLSAVQSAGIPYQVLRPGDRIPVGERLSLQAVHTNPLVLTLETEGSRWLLLGSAGTNVQAEVTGSPLLPPQIDWLWWDGGAVVLDLLERFQVQAGITSGPSNETVAAWFRQRQRPLYVADRSGAVSWSRRGVQTLRSSLD